MVHGCSRKKLERAQQVHGRRSVGHGCPAERVSIALEEAAFRDAMRHSIVTNYGLDMMVERTAHLLALLAAGRPVEEITRELAD